MPTKKKTTAATPDAPAEEDLPMNEAPAPAEVEDEDELEEEDPHNPAIIAFEEKRIRLLPGSTETAASFEFKKEDHTLGNALRYIIMKNPDVEFCGYSIPHPSEDVMNIRIQTYRGTATEALEKGFDDLMDLCDVVTDKFESARSEFMDKDKIQS